MSNGFVANDGQLPPSVQFEVDLGTGLLQLFDDGFNLNLPTIQWEQSDPSNPHTKRPQISKRGDPHDVRLAFVGSNRSPQLVARDRLSATLSDFRGDDQSKWRRDLSQYASVSYHDLYPNTMLDYTLDATGGFKSTYVVAPHGDPTLIRWRYQGVQDVTVAPDGSLVLTLPPRAGFATRTISESAPLAWQDVNGDRVFVPVRFEISHGKQVSFSVGQYDSALPLVIDPTLTVGYTVPSAVFQDVAVHPDGTWYVVGCNSSANGAKLWHLNTLGSGTINITTMSANAGCGGSLAIDTTGMIVASATDDPSVTVGEDVLLMTWRSDGTMVSQRVATGLDVTSWLPVAIQRGTSNAVVQWTTHSAPSGGGTYAYYLAPLTNGVLGSPEILPANSTLLGVDSMGAVFVASGNELTRRVAGGSWQTLTNVNSIRAWDLDRTSDTLNVVDMQIQASNQVIVSIKSYTRDGVLRWIYTLPSVQPYNPFSDIVMLSDGSVLAVGWSDSTSLPIVGSPTVINASQRGIYWAKIAANGSGITASDMVYPSTNYGQFAVRVASNAVDTTMLAVHTFDNGIRASYVATLDFGVGTETLPTAPKHTRSYYVQSTSLDLAQQSGCDARRSNERGMLVLAFGRPEANGVKFVYAEEDDITSLSQVEEWIMAFAIGYAVPNGTWRGLTCQNWSNSTPASLLIIAGLSNSAVESNGTWNDNPNLTNQTGQAWADMINRLHRLLNDPIVINGTTVRINTKVQIAAGFDAESYQTRTTRVNDPTPVPGGSGVWQWSTYIPSKAWLIGYDARQIETGGKRPVYIFGSCEDCPRTGTPFEWWSNGTTAEILRRVLEFNYDIFSAYPLPQIYKAPYPHEWYNVRWYAKTTGRSDFEFLRIMTECDDSNCTIPSYPTPRLTPKFDCASTGFGCSGDWFTFDCSNGSDCPDFTPSAGWQALDDLLRDQTRGAGQFYRAPTLYITDICHQVGPVNVGVCDQGQQ